MKQIIVVVISLILTGCSSLAATGITSVGYSLVQERSVGNAIDDVTISTKINAHYLKEMNGKLFKHVAVEVLEGRVLLTGNVQSPDDRVEAVRIAWQVEGVKEVINEIQINQKESLENYMKDALLTTQIRGKLFLNGDVKSINYSIDTVNRIVYVMGIAASREELDAVNHTASTVKGVKKVVSYARIKKSK